MTFAGMRSRDGVYEYIRDVVQAGAASNMQISGYLNTCAFVFATRDPRDGRELENPLIVLVDGVNAPKDDFVNAVRCMSTRTMSIGVAVVSEMVSAQFDVETFADVQRKLAAGKAIDLSQAKTERCIFLNLEHIAGNRRWFAKVQTVHGMFGVCDWEELPDAVHASKESLFGPGLTYGGWQ